MPEGITTIEEAFAAAKLEELNAGAAPEGVGAPPAVAPEGPPASDDQPSASDPEAQALIDSLVEQPGDEAAIPAIEDPRFWTQQAEANGELVTLGEMRNGYMRHDDYTRKTQEVAEQRRTLEEAEKFLESFNADPLEFTRSMAVEYGWIDPETTTPVVEVPIPQVLSDEELDARLQEMLDERVSADPRVLAAQQTEAMHLIESEFDRIGQDMKITIPAELRESLLAEAHQRQVFDLELLLKARLASHQRTSDNLIRSGALRPGSAGGLGSQPEQPQQPITVEEAWAQAKAEAQSGR